MYLTTNCCGYDRRIVGVDAAGEAIDGILVWIRSHDGSGAVEEGHDHWQRCWFLLAQVSDQLLDDLPGYAYGNDARGV